MKLPTPARPRPATTPLLLLMQRWWRHLARWAADLLAPPRRVPVPIPVRATPPPTAGRRRQPLR